MKLSAGLLFTAGILVLLYAFATEHLFHIIISWTYLTAPATPVGKAIALGVVGGLLIWVGVALWKKASPPV